jgi:hypothetical protein
VSALLSWKPERLIPRVPWELFVRVYDRDAARKRQREATRAAEVVSLFQDRRQATAWYNVTRSGPCLHPGSAVMRVCTEGLTFCTCTACGLNFKELPLVDS